MLNKFKKEKDTNTYYEFNKEYSVIEIVIKEGQTIPKYGDKIAVHQHDEITSIDFDIILFEIMERTIVNNELVLLIKYRKI
jgi:hypothetical protein